MRALGEKLFAAAVGGDWQAAKLFLLFVVGRPADTVNPDALDLDEFRLLASAPSKGRVLLEFLDALPPGPVCELLQTMRAGTVQAESVLAKAGEISGDRPQVFLQERDAKRAKSH
jgi:hypothetical protein